MMAQSNDFKYVIQDFGNIYIGARYTYGEMVSGDEMPFKWKAIVRHYFLKEVAPETTLEDHIFFLKEEDLSYQTLKELKASFKMSVWSEAKKHYESREYKITDIINNKELHERMDHIVVEEMHLGKLSLLSFAV